MGAIQVTSSRKGAKSRTHGRKVRSTRTKATTRVGQGRKPRADLDQQLEKYRHELAEAREQQMATSEVLKVISSLRLHIVRQAPMDMERRASVGHAEMSHQITELVGGARRVHIRHIETGDRLLRLLP
jgi:hypothetical protein